MKKRIISLIMLMAMVLAAAVGTAADTNIVDSMDFQGDGMELSLEKALELGMKNNPTLLGSQVSLENAMIDADKLDSSSRSSKKSPLVGSKGSGSYMLAVDLPELSADIKRASAELSYEATGNSVKASIEQSYYGVQQAQDIVQINEENMKVSKDLLEKSKKKFELGMIAKQEVLSAELSYIKADNDYDAAVNTYKKAKMALNIMLGNDVMTELNLTDELEFKAYEPVAIAEAINSALENRYEVKGLEGALEIAKLNSDASRKLYDSITYTYRSAETGHKKALADLESGKKNVEMGVRSDYMDLLQKKKAVESGQKSVELAEQGLIIAQATYDAGMAVMTDVESAQTTLKQAKLGLSKAILDYNLAISKFEDNMGIGRSASSSSYGG